MLIATVVPSIASSRKVEVKVTYDDFCKVYFVQAFRNDMHFGMSDTHEADVFDAMSVAQAKADAWAVPVVEKKAIKAKAPTINKNTNTNEVAKSEFDILTVAKFLVVLGSQRFEVVMTYCDWADVNSYKYTVEYNISGAHDRKCYASKEAAQDDYDHALKIAAADAREAMKFI